MNSDPLSALFHRADLAHRDWPYRRSAVLRYGVAALAVVTAFLIRYLLYGDLNDRLVFTFFVPAAMLAAWYGGAGPGFFATALGLVLGSYFFWPEHALWLAGARELRAMGVYAGTTILCIMFCENLHKSIRHHERLLAQLRHDHDGRNDPSLISFLDADVVGHGNWLLQRSILARYGVAIAAVAVAFLLRYWLFGTQDPRFPFVLFVPAAMIATWYGGMAPGMLATAAGLMLGDYFFLSEHEAMGLVRESERLAIGMYSLTTTMCVMLFENLHVHISRIEHAIGRAHQHHDKAHPDHHAPAAFAH